jgi:uncharacterized surface protein with fasciclin (FAS1) repeats
VVLVVLALLGLALPACDGGGTDVQEFGDDLVGRFESRDRDVPLAEALALTGLDDELRSGGPYTVLAPTRTAFVYIGTDFSPVLFSEAQRETLRRVLRHHVVPGELGPDDFADGASLTALDGTTLRVRRIGPVVTVNGVTVDLEDPTEASNGVAYPIADVLLDVLSGPERLRLSPLLSTFAGGARSTGVLAQAEGLERVTILAPLNDAYAALGGGAALLAAAANADVLARTHRAQVLPGDVDLATLGGQTVTTLGGDVLPVTVVDGVIRVAGLRVLHQEVTADGRVYILAEPLLTVLSLSERLRIRPEFTLYTAAVAAAPAARAALQDRSAGVTVFAPSDFAYANRNPALSEALAEATQAPLVRRITGAHVVLGRFTRADLVDGLLLTTLDGTVLRVDRSGGGIFIDGRPLPPGEPLEAVNGLLYGVDFFVIPNVDLLDTILLREYVGFFRAVRRAGLEPAYRTTVRTAFVLPDPIATAAFREHPDLALILRRTATTTRISDLPALPLPFEFVALDGSERAIVPVDCSLTPGDGGCSRFALGSLIAGKPEGGVHVYDGLTTRDGSAVFHELRGVDELPVALRAAR